MTDRHSPRVVGLQHVSLPFPGTPESMDVARRFYGDTLCLEARPVPPSLPGTVMWWAAGELEVHLFPEPSGVAVNDQSRRHMCLEVDDIDGFRAHLERSNVATIDNDGEIPGRPRFFALDPFGNAIEFVQLLPDHW
jgi:catechol 2,3-dioxygenase-like lactoylglutathione lyase family enzyme